MRRWRASGFWISASGRLGHKFCASLFGEAGAEVVSIEPPGGDPLRKLTPFGREEYMLQNTESGEKCGMEFVNETVNTHCVTLDVETEDGREIFKKMAQNVDVLIDGMPPGYMDGLGIGYRQLKEANPRMVYVWIGMLGQWGPWKDKQSKFGQWMIEPFASAANSWIHNTGLAQDLLPRGRGGDPTRSGIWLADYVAGAQGFVNALAALYWRDELGGTGQMIEVTGAEALMDIIDFDITWYGFNASIKARSGGWDPNLNQYAWNPCKDGYMMIGGQTDKLWYNIGFCLEREYYAVRPADPRRPLPQGDGGQERPARPDQDLHPDHPLAEGHQPGRGRNQAARVPACGRTGSVHRRGLRVPPLQVPSLDLRP